MLNVSVTKTIQIGDIFRKMYEGSMRNDTAPILCSVWRIVMNIQMKYLTSVPETNYVRTTSVKPNNIKQN